MRPGARPNRPLLQTRARGFLSQRRPDWLKRRTANHVSRTQTPTEAHGKAPEENPATRAKQSQGNHGSHNLQQKDVSSGQWSSAHTLRPTYPRKQHSLRTHGRKHRGSTDDWRGKPSEDLSKETFSYITHNWISFDHPYDIHKSLHSETSTFLLANRYIILTNLITIFSYISSWFTPVPYLVKGPGLT